MALDFTGLLQRLPSADLRAMLTPFLTPLSGTMLSFANRRLREIFSPPFRLGRGTLLDLCVEEDAPEIFESLVEFSSPHYAMRIHLHADMFIYQASLCDLPSSSRVCHWPKHLQIVFPPLFPTLPPGTTRSGSTIGSASRPSTRRTRSPLLPLPLAPTSPSTLGKFR